MWKYNQFTALEFIHIRNSNQLPFSIGYWCKPMPKRIITTNRIFCMNRTCSSGSFLGSPFPPFDKITLVGQPLCLPDGKCLGRRSINCYPDPAMKIPFVPRVWATNAHWDGSGYFCPVRPDNTFWCHPFGCKPAHNYPWGPNPGIQKNEFEFGRVPSLRNHQNSRILIV